MTDTAIRVTEDRFPGLILAVRDMDEADSILRRTFKQRDVATRREFAPTRWSARLRWMRDKVFFKEVTL